jgi:hypothetical protein
MLATFQIQHLESFKLFLKNGSTSVLCCILHPGLNIVVRKIQWWIMKPNFFHSKQFININSKYWQDVRIKKLKVSLKYARSECISLSKYFDSFESSFFILQKKTKMAKKMLTIFQIQDRKILKYFWTNWSNSVVFCTLG